MFHMLKPFTTITFDRSTLAQSRQHQKCKHEKVQLQAMHDDQNFVGLLKKYFLIKYTRLSNIILSDFQLPWLWSNVYLLKSQSIRLVDRC